MILTEKQLARRKEFIGASEVASILGLNPWRSAWDLWALKTGRIEEPTEQPESQVLKAGTVLERSVLDYAQEELGYLLRNQRRIVHGLDFPLAATCDAICRSDGTPVEAKTSGLFGPLKDAWGDAGTDQVPDHILVQVQVQMMATRTELAHVAAFLGGRGFNMYELAFNKDLAGIILERCRVFWIQNVQGDVPPEGMPSIAIARRMRREPNKIVSLSAAGAFLLGAWRGAKNAAATTQQDREQCEAALLAYLGDAEAGEVLDLKTGLPTGERVTYLSQKRKGFTVEPSEFRVLRYNAAKKEERNDGDKDASTGGSRSIKHLSTGAGTSSADQGAGGEGD